MPASRSSRPDALKTNRKAPGSPARGAIAERDGRPRPPRIGPAAVDTGQIARASNPRTRDRRAVPRLGPQTFARQAFGIVGGEEAIKVRLLFEPQLSVYITERQWHPTQEFRTRPDGRVEMRMETTGRKELVSWVLFLVRQ
ncbi:MAG: WYL domain-containing protein [Lentisphaerae bacterium]|nr:WYL domain-containing protein [Lentisphaerota bacterium]